MKQAVDPKVQHALTKVEIHQTSYIEFLLANLALTV
jgi:hypothetical protein